MHEVAQGNSLWAFTRTTDGRYVLAAELIVQAKKEMRAVGLEWVETKEMLPRQHFMVFRKPVE